MYWHTKSVGIPTPIRHGRTSEHRPLPPSVLDRLRHTLSVDFLHRKDTGGVLQHLRELCTDWWRCVVPLKTVG
jgi:hypothetical protein